MSREEKKYDVKITCKDSTLLYFTICFNKLKIWLYTLFYKAHYNNEDKSAAVFCHLVAAWYCMVLHGTAWWLHGT